MLHTLSRASGGVLRGLSSGSVLTTALVAVTPGLAALQQGSGLHTSAPCSKDAVESPHVPKLQKEGSTVVLVSGGIESAALLSYWTHWSHGQELHPLFVELGYRSEPRELHAAKALCQHLGLELSVLNASMLARDLRDTQTSDVKESRRIVPHRNLLLLALGASFGAGLARPATHLAATLNQDYLNTYSTSSTAFLRHADSLLETLDPPMQLLTPLARLSKYQVVQLGESVGAPWKYTYVCLEGGQLHCGKCRRCVERQEAFDRAGVQEPWGIYE